MAALIGPLASGYSDAASGTAEFYERGTNTAAVVFADYDAATVRTSHALDSNGRIKRYVTTVVDVVVKDADGDTVDTFTWGGEAGTTAVSNLGFTGVETDGTQDAGGVTDVDTVLTGLFTSLNGLDGRYTEEGSTTSRYLYAAIGKYVSPADFGATGADTADESSYWQNALNRAIAANKPLWVEPGTYRIGTGLTVSGSTAAGLTIVGANRGDVILKNTSSSNTLLTIDLSSAIDSKILIENISITATTTSSGKGILLSNGDKAMFRNVSVALHRTGIDVNAVSAASLDNCVIASTDDNAAAIGINLGNRGRADKCEVVCATANGTGIKATGTDVRITDCYTSGWSKGIDYAGARTIVRGAHISAATVGANMGAANGMLTNSYLVLNTTGVAVGAVASNVVFGNVGASNTTDMTVNASATLFVEGANTFTTVTNSGSTPATVFNRMLSSTTTNSAASPTLTPDLSAGVRLFIYKLTNAGTPAATVAAATGTAAISKDEIIEIIVANNSGGGSIAGGLAFSSVYRGVTGNNAVNYTGVAFGGSTAWYFRFRWSGSEWYLVSHVASTNTMTY